MNICLGVHRGRCICGKFVFDLLPSQFFFSIALFGVFFFSSVCLVGLGLSCFPAVIQHTFIHLLI